VRNLVGQASARLQPARDFSPAGPVGGLNQSPPQTIKSAHGNIFTTLQTLA